MTFHPHGKHLVGGEWVAGPDSFASQPAHGAAYRYSVGTPDLVDRACEAAEDAFWTYGYSTRASRAAFLNAIADEIEVRGDAITAIGTQETGLPAARLQGERGRTVGQLRLFADHILAGDYLDIRHDQALPDRAPIPRPDLRLVQRPVGPVAVFGASNFPLAFSTAGGDTAAALAAGCPVVVKGHSAHPGTSEIVGEAVFAAMTSCGVSPDVFSLVQGGDRAVGASLVQHPNIKAVGFTGSLAGGRALFDLCAQRPEPIPFFGELGSINPVFILPNAARQRAAEIAAGWAVSLTLGAGQFCTNPGVVFIEDGADADAFVSAAKAALEKTEAQVMLTDGIAASYCDGRDGFLASTDVRQVLVSDSTGRMVSPDLFETTAAVWNANGALREEVFGPLGLVVRVSGPEEMAQIARSLEGQLTVTFHHEPTDGDEAKRLLPIIERKAGRILANGFPTGVEVCDAMVHGGPFPASTNFGATSVGTLSIRRFLRPVCFQDVPDALLPIDG